MLNDEPGKSDYTFISYSHDSEEHRMRVREKADDLIGKGLPTEVDLYQQFPSEGWPTWMQRMIALGSSLG